MYELDSLTSSIPVHLTGDGGVVRRLSVYENTFVRASAELAEQRVDLARRELAGGVPAPLNGRDDHRQPADQREDGPQGRVPRLL